MGGLSRKLYYINTLKKNNINPIIIDAGDALFARPQYSVSEISIAKYKAEAFLHGYEKVGCDALNIGEFDLAAGYDFLKKLNINSKIPFISANLRLKETGDLAFKPFVIINQNKLKIGIIGVTDYLPQNIAELYKDNYLETGQKYIKELRDKVDILILLVNGNINQKDTIVESFKDADYIYLSRTISNTRNTIPQKEGYPIFYTIGLNGKRLIQVKTTIKDNQEPILDISANQARLTSIVRQLIKLKTTEGNQTVEQKYAEKPIILKQIKDYEKQVKIVEENLSQIVNTSEIKIVPMPKNMEFDADIQSFIDNELKKSKNQ